jgi:serine/threonine protein kinase
VIHGDLKPHNVFMPSPETGSRTNRLFFLKLSDFSLGRRVDETEARLRLGTIGYGSGRSEKRTSHQSDLFALGVTAYQMFTVSIRLWRSARPGESQRPGVRK